jgi:hypothetical protein
VFPIREYTRNMKGKKKEENARSAQIPRIRPTAIE